MTLSPLGDHVVVKPRRESQTAAGLVIPDTVGETKTDRGEVVAVGPGRLLDDGARGSMEVNVGDHVLFSKYAADEVEVDGETLLILTQPDIKTKIQENR